MAFVPIHNECTTGVDTSCPIASCTPTGLSQFQFQVHSDTASCMLDGLDGCVVLYHIKCMTAVDISCLIASSMPAGRSKLKSKFCACWAFQLYFNGICVKLAS